MALPLHGRPCRAAPAFRRGRLRGTTALIPPRPEDRMAEIRVQPKRRSLVWLWVLLALAAAALVAWLLVRQGLVRVETTGAAGARPAALA
jgi:hypothetical protein